jgi:hypothetical protein
MGTSNAHKEAMKIWSQNQSVQNQIKYNQDPKLCKNCQLPIPYSKRHSNSFCNQSCSATYTNTRRRLRPTRNCLCCNKELVGRKSMKYCSNKCQKKYQRNELRNEWYNNNNSPGWSSIKSILFEDRGNKCEVCNISEWNNKPLSLEVDHIDGNHTNNNPNNLRIICPNCHSQTDTYKARNIGNGRHCRRERYSSGQSY